jgi:hypothetical protein
MREFESSHSSQAVRQPEILPSVVPEKRASGGLLQFFNRSLRSESCHFRARIGDSLQRLFGMFPFLGDRGRRLGSNYIAWPCGSLIRSLPSGYNVERGVAVFLRQRSGFLLLGDSAGGRVRLALSAASATLQKSHLMIWLFDS